VLVNERQLRRRCRRLLNELDIRPPLDVAELCQRVGQQRGKPIQLRAHPIPVPGPFGLWYTTKTTDYIFYQQETSAPHQRHIILHELGHLLAGHQSTENDQLLPDLSSDTLREKYPDLEPDAVRRALRRTSYDTEQEREAETTATIILEWASVLDHVASSRRVSEPVQRMEAALHDRLGWL